MTYVVRGARAPMGDLFTDIVLPRVFGGQPIEDLVRNALPGWAGGMQITPAQADKIAQDVAKMSPRLPYSKEQIAQEILRQSIKNPATLPGDKYSPFAWATSNAGGDGTPSWTGIGIASVALYAGLGLGALWIGGKVLNHALK